MAANRTTMGIVLRGRPCDVRQQCDLGNLTFPSVIPSAAASAGTRLAARLSEKSTLRSTRINLIRRERDESHCDQDQFAVSAVSLLQAAASFGTRWTSLIRPVSTSKIKPRTGTSLAIHGCDLTVCICSRVFCSGSLKEKRRIGAGDASPVEAVSFAFSSSSVNVVNPQPV